MNEKIVAHIADGVATLAFNRPASLNALDDEMIIALRSHCEALADDAAGKALCPVQLCSRNSDSLQGISASAAGT